jgi:hypothetical protein
MTEVYLHLVPDDLKAAHRRAHPREATSRDFAALRGPPIREVEAGGNAATNGGILDPEMNFATSRPETTPQRG